MQGKNVPEAAVARNKAWITAVTQSLAERGDAELLQGVMKDAGRRCAAQLLEMTIAHYGKALRNVDELIEAINKRREEVLRATTFWTREGDTALFQLEQCSCDMVQAGLAEPNPHFCNCSAGMFAQIFSHVCTGPVSVDILKSIGRGDDHCEFVIHFAE